MVFQCSIKMNPCYLMTLNLAYESLLFMKKKIVQQKCSASPLMLLPSLSMCPAWKSPQELIHFKTSRSHVLMQKKSTGLKSDRIKHKLMRMEKRQESGYGNIEIYCTDSFVKSHQKLQSRTCQNKVEQKWQWQEFGKTKQLF